MAAPKYVRELVRTTRKRLQLTQVQLGMLLGQHYATIARWERNNTSPPYYRQLLRELGKLDDLQAGSIRARLAKSHELSPMQVQERGALALLWAGKAAVEWGG